MCINTAAPIKQTVEIRTPTNGILNQYFLAKKRYEKPINIGRHENHIDSSIILKYEIVNGI